MAKKRNGQPQAQNGPKADKLWRQALLLEVNALAADKKTKRLRLVARAVIQQAMKGDVMAAREIGDRLDGKAVSQINVRQIKSLDDLSEEELIALASGSGKGTR